VARLNADRLDGKNSTQIGVNGLDAAVASSANNSNSPKSVSAECPSGKVVVGGFYNITGGKTGSPPNQQTDVVVDALQFSSTQVTVEDFEEDATNASWDVVAIARCARAP
jgi:hypothetical protein